MRTHTPTRSDCVLGKRKGCMLKKSRAGYLKITENYCTSTSRRSCKKSSVCATKGAGRCDNSEKASCERARTPTLVSWATLQLSARRAARETAQRAIQAGKKGFKSSVPREDFPD